MDERSECGDVDLIGVSFHDALPPQARSSRGLEERIVITGVEVTTGQ